MVLATRSGTKVYFEMDSHGKLVTNRVEHDDEMARAMKKSQEWIRKRSPAYLIPTPRIPRARNSSYVTSQSLEKNIGRQRPFLLRNLTQRQVKMEEGKVMLKKEPAEEKHEMKSQRPEDVVRDLGVVLRLASAMYIVYFRSKCSSQW